MKEGVEFFGNKYVLEAVYELICRELGSTINELSSSLRVDEESIKECVEILEKMGLVKTVDGMIYPADSPLLKNWVLGNCGM